MQQQHINMLNIGNGRFRLSFNQQIIHHEEIKEVLLENYWNISKRFIILDYKKYQ